MSPDRTTITRAEAIRRRKDEEQKQREKLTQRNITNVLLQTAMLGAVAVGLMPKRLPA